MVFEREVAHKAQRALGEGNHRRYRACIELFGGPQDGAVATQCHYVVNLRTVCFLKLRRDVSCQAHETLALGLLHLDKKVLGHDNVNLDGHLGLAQLDVAEQGDQILKDGVVPRLDEDQNFRAPLWDWKYFRAEFIEGAIDTLAGCSWAHCLRRAGFVETRSFFHHLN